MLLLKEQKNYYYGRSGNILAEYLVSYLQNS